jgi:medium-chain acyl-[acyl-carrier-protein] hydrolase
MDEKNVWKEDLSIKSYEMDCYGKMKLSSLFNAFQEVAGNHASALGAGYTALQKMGLFWVLSRAMVRIARLPAWGENIALSTWPKGQDGPLFVRDFRMTTGNGENLLDASTGWLLLDTQHNKPHTADALPIKIPPNEAGHAIQEPLKKIRPLQGDRAEFERKVMLSDLDVNNHVNNAKYVEWILDCYSIDDVKSKTVRNLQINYIGEAVFGDAVRLHKIVASADTGEHYIEGARSATGTKVIQALIHWQ